MSVLRGLRLSHVLILPWEATLMAQPCGNMARTKYAGMARMERSYSSKKDDMMMMMNTLLV